MKIIINDYVLLQVWFQNRRAKYRKKENTKKGPGRPAHNAHPQSCSGEPMSPEELVRKEKERREKKLYKQLEKQQKKLSAKGIHVDMDTLRKDYETQRAGGKSTLNLEAALAAASEEIDVVGGVEDSLDCMDDEQTRLKQMEADIKKKISPFSIESLLAKRQLSVQAAAIQAAASMKTEEELNNNPPSSPIPTSCSSPLSRGSMASPDPNPRYLSTPSPNHQAPGSSGTSAPASLHFPIPLFPSSSSASTVTSLASELSLLKPLTSSPSSFLSKFDPSKISFSSTLANLKPEPIKEQSEDES